MMTSTLGLMSDIQMELRKMGQKQRLIPDEALAYVGREVLPQEPCLYIASSSQH